MKVRDMLKRLAQDGWVLVRSKGSHRQFHHPTKPGTVTVSGHPRDAIHPDTLKSMMQQSGLGQQP